MARKESNWFKHSQRARMDPKICKLIEMMGVSGYAYYFMLLELCNDNADIMGQQSFDIHENVLRSCWHTRGDIVRKIMNNLQTVGLLSWDYRETLYHIRIANLPKYNGSKIQTRLEETRLDQTRIEKNRKEESETRLEETKAREKKHAELAVGTQEAIRPFDGDGHIKAREPKTNEDALKLAHEAINGIK